MELNQTNSLLQDKNLPDTVDSDALVRALFTIANSSNAMDLLKLLNHKKKEKRTTDKTEKGGHLTFTQKEIDFMPDSIKKLLIVNNHIITYREHRGTYEARYRRGGYNISVCGKTLDILKARFIEALTSKLPANREETNYPLMSDCLQEWLRHKGETVKQSTLDDYKKNVRVHIIPMWGNKKINEVTRTEIQDYLFSLVNQGKKRTAQKVKQTLSAAFDVIAEDYNIKSPMTKIVLLRYKSKKGKALTKEEEKLLVERCIERQTAAYASAILILLYTGMRIGELKTAKIVQGKYSYIECETEKTRKGDDTVYRKIPISPMLRKVMPYIDFERAASISHSSIEQQFKAILPEHKPHHLRYTFITRAKEAGCNFELVMLWDGHKFDKDTVTTQVDRGYTDYSEDYYFNEIEKINYDL